MHDPDARLAVARRVIEQIDLRPGTPRACPYLPTQQARDVAFHVGRLPAGLYHSLMDLNFRRSGHIVYRPACDQCRQCQAIRVRTDLFRPDRSQRRCWLRNRDLTIGITPPHASGEKYALYRRYLRQRHDGRMEDSYESFRDFLYSSPVDTVEITYRRDGRLAGVGIVDLDGEAASTVYCYYDPDDRGSLGTYNILWTIEWCRRLGIPWVYLGYQVRDCRKMNYKMRFRPNEVLDSAGRFVPSDSANTQHKPCD
jgi:arginine-tRNA-protein transferase